MPATNRKDLQTGDLPQTINLFGLHGIKHLDNKFLQKFLTFQTKSDFPTRHRTFEMT